MMTSAESRRPEKQKSGKSLSRLPENLKNPACDLATCRKIQKSGKDSEKEIQRDDDKWQIVRLSLSRYGKMQAS
jgi:hypothetical protein